MDPRPSATRRGWSPGEQGSRQHRDRRLGSLRAPELKRFQKQSGTRHGDRESTTQRTLARRSDGSEGRGWVSAPRKPCGATGRANVAALTVFGLRILYPLKNSRGNQRSITRINKSHGSVPH